jgi:hypothetical protein
VYRYISHYTGNNSCDDIAVQREAGASSENDFVFGCGILRFEKANINFDSDYIFIFFASKYAHERFKRGVSVQEIRKGATAVIARSYDCGSDPWQLSIPWCYSINSKVLDLIDADHR